MRSSERPRAGEDRLQDAFASGGMPITVDWFEGAGSGSRPAVVMLHGAEGLAMHEGYHDGAREIAAGGIHVALLHYLDRTGERRASYARIVQNFMPWLETVRDAIGWTGSRAGVDPERIGLVGISLGGSLALATASRERRVKALVTYFAPLPTGAMIEAALPPTLVLHGAADPIVPVANAHAIEALLVRTGAPSEIKIYPGQGHGFHGAALTDANRRVAAFLERHLTATPADCPASKGESHGERDRFPR